MATIKIPKLQKNRTDTSDSALSSAFISALEPVARLTATKAPLVFDLSNPGWLTPAEIVTLASNIRNSAEHGSKCQIKLPDDPDSSFMWTLHSFRFAQVLGAINPTDAWQKNINFLNYRPIRRDSERLTLTKRVLPISWIDTSTFGYGNSIPNLYLEEPEFNAAYVRFISGVLSRHGFIAEDAIDDFVRGILREIGWNAVLHSRKGRGWGFAAFGGQVSDDGLTLEFALADCGCGIAFGLLAPYREARRRGSVADYAREFQCSEQSAAVRFAFDSSSTSRTEFPSEYDIFSDRGLALVSEIILEGGSLSVASSGAMVTIKSHSSRAFGIRDLSVDFQGTCLFGRLLRSDVVKPSSLMDDHDDGVDSITSKNVLPLAVLFARRPNRSLIFLRRALASYSEKSTLSVVDFGFVDTSSRMVENCIAIFLIATKATLLTVVNARSSRVSAQKINSALEREFFKNKAEVRIIASDGRVKKFIFNAAGDQNSNAIDNWLSQKMEESKICDIHFQSSTAFLKLAFHLLGPQHGFFHGNIHLLSGNVTSKYFSLLANLEAFKNDGACRWNDSFGRLLDVALKDTSKSRAKLLGFAASVRPIMESIDNAHPIKDEVYCLLTYDAPSKSELAEVINYGDDVILFTDVISTASLLREVVALIRKIGANIVAVIALVDARTHPSEVWKNVIEQEVEEVPLLLAASLDRKVVELKKYSIKEYWIDPVSAIPLTSAPESKIDVERILRTIEVINHTSSATIGHFVDGLRHTSTRINIGKLLHARTQIQSWTECIVASILEGGDWRNFNPQIALVPVGINRIDKVGIKSNFSENNSTSEQFAELSVGLFPSIRKVAPISRTFSPGGKASCSSIGYISSPEGLADLIIVDDGMSSGATIRSLAFQAVKSGAKRILVIALLARSSLEELEQWQITREVSDRTLGVQALVSLVCPLHLPIPFAGDSECAQCTTLSSLGSRRNSSPLSNGWRTIQKELEAPYKYAASSLNREYEKTWILVHSLSEIASRSVEGFEKLKNYLEQIFTEGDDSSIKREAVVRLYLIEWRLLGTSRLRQIIRRIVRSLAFSQLESTFTDDLRFIEALSLVRSMFPTDYLSILSKYSSKIAFSHAILDRVLFHLETFNSIDHEIERHEVLQKLISHLEKDGLDSMVKDRQRRLEGLIGSLDKFSKNIDIAYKVQSLKMALRDHIVMHDIIPTLIEVRKISPERLDELTEVESYFSSLAKQIDEVVEPALKSTIYPLLNGMDDLIGKQLENLELLDQSHKTYFFHPMKKTDL